MNLDFNIEIIFLLRFFYRRFVGLLEVSDGLLDGISDGFRPSDVLLQSLDFLQRLDVLFIFLDLRFDLVDLLLPLLLLLGPLLGVRRL